MWNGPKGIQTDNGLERMEKTMQGGCRMCSKATGRLCTGCGAILDVEWVRLSYNLNQSWGDAGRKKRINLDLAIHALSGYPRFRRLECPDLHVFCRFLMKSGDPEGAGYGVGFVAVSSPDPRHCGSESQGPDEGHTFHPSPRPRISCSRISSWIPSRNSL